MALEVSLNCSRRVVHLKIIIGVKGSVFTDTDGFVFNINIKKSKINSLP